MAVIRFYAGSYAGAQDPGIALCSYDTEKNAFSVIRKFSGVENPIYFARSGSHLYTCAAEGTKGAAAVFSIGEDGGLSLKGIFADGGAGCCHVFVSSGGRFLAASNYGDGSLSLFRLEEDGDKPVLTDLVQHHGRSVHWKRQNEAHVHSAFFAGEDLFSCDLGEDRIYRYHVDPETGKLEEVMQYKAAGADGPRHLVIDQKHGELFCINEMGACVTVFDVETGRCRQRIRSIDESVAFRRLKVGDFDAFGAAIRITEDGKRVLASNRGDNSIAVFSVQEDGLLRRLGVYQTGGVMPRDFVIAGDMVFAANQESGTVTALAWNEDRTALTFTGASLALSRVVAIYPL